MSPEMEDVKDGLLVHQRLERENASFMSSSGTSCRKSLIQVPDQDMKGMSVLPCVPIVGLSIVDLIFFSWVPVGTPTIDPQKTGTLIDCERKSGQLMREILDNM